MSYLRIFGLKFKECIVIIEIIFEIFLKEKFCAKKKKSLSLEPKMNYLCYLGDKFEKLFSYLKSAASNLLIAKFSEINKYA